MNQKSTLPYPCPQRSFTNRLISNFAVNVGTVFPYLLCCVGPRADPGVQEVSPQVMISHPPGGRLPLPSARPVVTFPAACHHIPLASTKLYCLVTDAHRCEQLAQVVTQLLPRVAFEITTC